jgi:uncharacterized protein YigE (DUF2233 family)
MLLASQMNWIALLLCAAPVADGIESLQLKLPHASRVGDSTAFVLRIDPKKHPVDLFGSAVDGKPRARADAWVERHALAAAINAGMFDTDMSTPVGFARAHGKALNPSWKKDYQAVFVSQPDDPKLPAADIVDLACDAGAKERIAKYQVALQSMRMVDCAGKNLWGPSKREWSAALLALDADGNVLFIHVRSPYTMHQLVDDLVASPLKIKKAMYLEGGPEASLVLDVTGHRVDRFGSFETGFNENDDNKAHWEIPNVLGVKK